MFTSAQCLAIAERKLVQAELDGRHRRRLITAAQAWRFLASKLGGEAPEISTERKTFRDKKDGCIKVVMRPNG